MAPVELSDHDTDCHRKDGKAGDNKGDRKDPSCIRNGRDLAKTDGGEGHTGLIDRVHKGKIVDDNIADGTDQHGHDSKDYW